MPAPTYSGINAIDNGTSNASTLGAAAPSAQVEQTTGIQLNPANTTTTYGRGWTHSTPLNMSEPGTVITYLVGRTGGASATHWQDYPAGLKIVLASSVSDYKKYLLLNTNTATFLQSTSKPGQNASTGALFHCALAPTTFLETNNVGTVNFSAINRVEIHGDGNGNTSVSFQAVQLFWAAAVVASLGESGIPITMSGLLAYAKTASGFAEGPRNQYAFPDIASSRIFQIPFSVRIGNGTDAFYCDDQSGFSLIFPQGNTSGDFAVYQHHLQIPPDWHRFRISPVNGSTCNLRGSISRSDGWHFVVDSYTGTFTNNLQLTLNNATSITLRSGINFSGSIAGGTGELTANGASLSNLTIRNTTGNGYTFNTSDTTSSLSFVGNTIGGRITSAGNYSNINASFSGNTTAIRISSAVTSGSIDLSNCTFSGNTTDIYWAGTTGSITITVGQTGLTTGTAGGTINLVEPVIALSAPNFAEGTRVQVQRVEAFTLANTTVNTSTNEITVAGNQFRTTSFPTLVTILQGSGTLPTSTPQVADRGLYYVVAKSGNNIKISKTEGGAEIDFTAQGSSSFTLIGYTELANSLAGSGGYSVNLSEANGTLLQVKAEYWAKELGIAKASIFFQSTYVWSTSAGVTIPDTLHADATPDTVHNAIAQSSSITLPNGSVVNPADAGDAITGYSFEADGTVEIDIDNATGEFLIPEAYLWFKYVVSTAAGIRIANNFNFVAEDLFNYVLDSVQLESVSLIPIYSVGGYVRSARNVSLISPNSNPIHLNSDQKGIAIATASGGGGDSVWSTTQRDQVLARTSRLDGLIENSGGDRFTAKALEQSKENRPFIDTK